MTFDILSDVLKKNNISEDVLLMSDIGWECCATNMDGVYYNKKKHMIVFTQHASSYDKYHKDPDWNLICGEYPAWDPAYEGEK